MARKSAVIPSEPWPFERIKGMTGRELGEGVNLTFFFVTCKGLSGATPS
jgi:hypothetical protein